MAKNCITTAFICFTLSLLPNLSNSRYLLVEVDSSSDMDRGMDVTTEGPEMPKPEEKSIDDLETETLPEDDKEGVMPEQEQKPTHAGGGYRSSN